MSSGKRRTVPTDQGPLAPRLAFERTYPAITRWIAADGWIEFGQDEFRHSLVRALDPGGMVWEGAAEYPSLDDALQALELALARWLREELGEP